MKSYNLKTLSWSCYCSLLSAGLLFSYVDSSVHAAPGDNDDVVATALVQESAEQKGDFYLNRAKEAINSFDYVNAKLNYELALQAVPSGSDKELDYVAEMAPAYMRAGLYEVACDILRPYVENGRANNRMKADYVIALRFAGKTAEAEKIFQTEFKDVAAMPTYGLQSIADMYFRAKQYELANSLYEVLLERDNEQPFVHLAHAYASAVLGKEEQAAQEYVSVAQKYPQRHDIIAEDAKTFVKDGKLHLARKLFVALGTDTKSKNAYKMQYADALAENWYLYRADKIYKELSKDEESRPGALLGLVNNKIRKGLYHDAEVLTKELEAQYGDSREAGMAHTSMGYDRLRGNAFTFFEHSDDYKGNEVTKLGIAGEHYLEHNFYVKEEYDTAWYKKNDVSARQHNLRLGPSYRFEGGHLDVLGVHSWGSHDANSVEVAGGYNFSDYASVAWQVGKRAHEEAGAVANHISEKYYTADYSQRVNDKTLLGFSYEKANLSDGNSYYSLGVDVTHNILNKEFHNNNLLVNYSYLTYNREADWYEAPQLRVAYGAGLSQKWLARDKKRSLELITMLNWGHDNSEPTDASPYARLEYVKQFSDRQKLTLGAEYGWHTNKLYNTSTLRQSHYNYYVNYYWEW